MKPGPLLRCFGAADEDCLSFEGAGVAGWAAAAERRGRSAVSGVAAADLGVAAARGIGFPGGTFSSPGIGVATAW